MLCSREMPGDRSIAQFIEILTTHYAVAELTHVGLGFGSLYQRKGEVMSNSIMELKNGMSKGVQPIEVNGKTVLALIVDGKYLCLYVANVFFFFS